jgi:alanine racemase
MQRSLLHSTWAEVDLGAIRNNVHYTQRQTGVQVMAIVKANAYGHGAVPVAQAALQGGATWLGVARDQEALELRRAGIEAPILLLGHTPAGHFDEMIANRVALTVWNEEQVRIADASAQRVGEMASLHLKVDTGMSRLGVQPEQAVGMARLLTDTPGVHFEGLFTHFAKADEVQREPSDLQERNLKAVLDALQDAGMRPQLVHAANSAASLTRPTAVHDMVRLGIAMYGLHPSPECPLPSEFRPALAWKSTLSQVKTLPAGRGVSYGHEYVTSSEERIGTLPVGYADGLRRTHGNRALVGGVELPVVGRVCMDQVMLQLDAVPTAQEGDEVVLIGEQEGKRISAEDVAQRWGTINYEVTCGISARVPRIYV